MHEWRSMWEIDVSASDGEEDDSWLDEPGDAVYTRTSQLTALYVVIRKVHIVFLWHSSSDMAYVTPALSGAGVSDPLSQNWE